jgi:hypothetical protein
MNNLSQKTSLKAFIAASSTAFALLLSLAASQPVHAAEAVGQMIDDSGLVICTYVDGSVKEFTPSESKLKTFNQTSLNTLHQGTVLSSALLTTFGPAVVGRK